MKYRIPGLAVILFFSLTVQAQLKLNATVADQQQPVAGVTILVHQKTNGDNFQVLTNNKGEFSLPLKKNSAYVLKLSHVGYVTMSLKIETEKTDVNLGILTLQPNTDLLSGVTIKSKKQGVKQKNDTLEFSSSAYKVHQDASAEDLVRKLPGISLEDGAVKSQGEEVKKVTIDGREFFGDDATAALKNLPAEIIDKIQVFDRMSDNAQMTGFDDGNSSKSINIITKAEMRNGRFGRVSAGYGTSKTYNAGGNLSYYSGKQRISLLGLANNVNQQNFSSQDIVGISQSSGKKNKTPKTDAGKNATNFSVGPKSGVNTTTATGVNFADLYAKKIELTASYFYNHTDNNNQETSSRNSFTGGDSLLNYQESRQSVSSGDNHRVNIRATYKVDSSNTIILTSKDHF
ncbi:MAG: carboxypeptidase-like regulatory domain-containing protein, partial [Chitinophagaceae bacterium]